MPPIKLTEVLSFSSEDSNHPAENLLKAETAKKWKCAAGMSEKQASVTLKFERLTAVRSIDIGNAGSAFVEVLAARADSDFKVLLVASSFMTPIESRNASDLHRVRMFGPEKLNKQTASEKWDRIKVICTQPFNKNLQYGLSFITLSTADEASTSTPKVIKLGSFTLKEEDDSKGSITIGSLFARSKAAPASPTAGGSSPGSGGLKRKALENPPDVGFYQLKKKPMKDATPERRPSTPKPEREASTSTPQRKDQDREKERNKAEKRPEKKEKKNDKPQPTNENGRKEEKKRRESTESEKKEKKRRDSTGGERNKERDKPSTSSNAPGKKKKSRPFTSLMNGVVFVMSGYQNPQRGNLRDMMLEMGAKYKQDWDRHCSHLICAFTNTPKFQQVKGKGKIVTAKWISDSHKNKIRYPWRRYQLEKGQSGEESEEEIWADEILPKEERATKATNQNLPSSFSETADEDYNSDMGSDDNEDTDDEIERILAKKKKSKEKENGDAEEHNNSTQKKEKNNDKKEPVKKEEEKPTKKIKRESEEEDSKRTVNGKKETTKIKQEPTEKTIKREVKEEAVDDVGEANGTVDEGDDSEYDADTDVDEDNKKYLKPPDTSAIPLPSLGEYFAGKTFLLYGKLDQDWKKLISRYIVAFKGIVEDYMSENVQYVITDDEWDDNFDSALEDNPSLQFVKPKWIWKCCDKEKIVPHQPYLVVPRE